MTKEAGSSFRGTQIRGVLHRFAIYLALWLVLIELSAANLFVGAVTSVCATWFSLRLLPLQKGRLSYLALLRLAVHSMGQSLAAGFDVARRALDPRMPLQVGFVGYPTNLEGGVCRNSFRVLTSLQPGTLPVSAQETGEIVFHCLDTRQPISQELSSTEALFSQLIRSGNEREAHDG